ncbi:hypothetical protein FB008_1226 [Sinorhizobium medicae]|uniref:hypothetical protein n=1 Tax=Sinorhizobium medicae TaxID=110321 RepID=UPI0011AD0E7B|nr:hypothetical protein [Sinorhizobium medicae]MDX0716990.1 hypothetical protein [Sinorhizobium medicae]MDX0846535.1 hypothetical protein [Sinorhizobium medicae]TWA46616.1 hypothetical protein FB008_1226 [Sinorhizobium medicae]
MSGKDLGFGGKLANITPNKDDAPRNPDAKVDEIGDRHGFVPREPIQKLTRRKPSAPSANLNIRPPDTSFNRFLQFCEKNRMSYPRL